MQKFDSFQPRRPQKSVDGFFTPPAGSNRPRQPAFRASSANAQPAAGTLAGMPQRPPQQPILSSASSVAGAPPVAEYPLPGVGQPRRRELLAEPPKKEKKRRGKRKLFKRAGLVIGVFVLVAGLTIGFKFYRNIANLTGNNNPLSLFSLFHPSHLKNDNGRVNILVAGNSADDAGHDGGDLTDSIMVLSLDTHTHSALMLSIPRDLWVDIPGEGYSKINAAYPDGGMSLLQKTVENNLDIPIHYQVLVNYTAFRDLVDAVGGITITIKSSDPRGIYDPSLDYTSRYCCALAKYPNGKVSLDGKQALNLARARGDAYGSYGFPQSDFDRTEHQRQMIMAIKDKVVSTNLITSPLEVSKLADAVGKNVRTNLQVNDLQSLYYYSKDISDSNIQSASINELGGKQLLMSFTTSSGQSALVPAAGVDDFSDIQAQIKKLFSNNPVAKESAKVVLLNGTDTVGLAAKQETILTAKGADIELIADAPATQATSTIVNNSDGQKPHTLALLKQLYSAKVTTNATLSAKYPDADFIVVLGANTAPKQATQP
jgi:LCP family protein required for cell wall assembly